MKNLIPSLLAFIFICCNTSVDAQSSTQQKLKENQRIDFTERPVALDDFFHSQQEILGLGQNDELIEKYSHSDPSGFVRTRYTQFYKGLEVIASSYVLHSKNDLVYKSSGILVPNIFFDISRTTSLAQVRKVAMDGITQRLIASEAITPDSDINWEITKQRKCIINKDYPKTTGAFVYAYEITLEGQLQNIPFKELVYINAANAEWINHSTQVMHESVPAQVETKYYGTQTLITDSIAPGNFQMVDSTRGIFTRDFTNSNQTLKDDDNFWTADDGGHVGGDAHYCTSSYHDYMQSHFNWTGLDGLGSDYLVNINQNGKYYVNAFWNGTYAAFGNGDCHRYGPLTTLDVVGHEFTHGFIDYTSDLIYQDQSGALNEASADIFGKALEYQYDPANFNWLIGDRFIFGPNVTPFRSMSDPHERNDPKYYAGQNYYTGAGDRGGVHTNSGVLNYWFYLLVEGGQDTNEGGYDFNVQAIGMDQAIDIVFGMHLGYLTPGSSFIDAFYASLDQTVDLYGINSMQYNNVIEAWKAVGIDSAIDGLDLSIESNFSVYDVCPDDLVYVNVTVRNQGTLPFPSGEILSLQFQQRNDFLVNEDYQLSQDLAPGDSIVYTFIQELQDSITHDGNMTISLVANDNNVLNNSDISSCKSSNNAGTDMELVTFRLTIPTCERTQITNVSYTLRNTGCLTISAGEYVDINLTTPSGTRSFNKILTTDLVPGGYLGASENISADPIDIDFTDFTADIIYLGDLLPDNNSFSSSITVPALIEEDYFEDYKNFTTPDYSLTFTSSYVEDSILSYQGNKMLAIAGKRDNPSFANCAELEDFFDTYNFTSKINFCIDAGDMEDPEFSFDHIQLRNEAFTNQNIDINYGVILQVTTDSMTYPLIEGINEGVLEQFVFALPYGYQGPLQIEILTNSGPTAPFDTPGMDNTDVALFDNFKLAEKGSTATNDLDLTQFSIFPNPVRDELTILSKDLSTPYLITISNNLGQQTGTIQGQGKSSFNTQNLEKGIYFLSIYLKGELVTTEKLLKL